MNFKLSSDYEPRGDQPEAIAELVRGVENGEKHQVLLGVTGSGKTFTMAKVIEHVNRPTLVLAHNKTLAAQLYHEFRGFFPHNAVEYFVSYYDYYQPEAYMPSSDTYIEKEATINDELDKLRMIDPLTGEVRSGTDGLVRVPIYPKSHYVVPAEQKERAIGTILEELDWWKAEVEKQGKYVEAQRLSQRTLFDIEMIRTIGYCHGIENYSRHLSGRLPGEAPPTLLDYVPQDYLLFVDESHQTVPQLHGMYHGDRSRKQTLVDFGFRLPSALDNRPLTFEEFEHRINQVMYVSATPGPYELTRAGGVVVEQLIRPTGLVDPDVEVRPVKGQVDDLLEEIRVRAARQERVLVTTLTKRMAEDLSEYFTEVAVRCRYLHSEVETLERVRILRDLRRGEFDVLIGINLLREGLDLPEVSLVAILDADKEGYLRSATALIQTMGRCARHISGKAILYADVRTGSMNTAIEETNRRRSKQLAYNRENHITPQSIIKSVDMGLARIVEADYITVPADDAALDSLTAGISGEADLQKSSNSSVPRNSATASRRSSSAT